jgi:two-component system, NarL family, nitrate/nitrite response regulator NarL
MLKIELLLRSRLVREALSSTLTAAGFSVLRERDGHDDHVTVIIDIDDCKELEVIGGHRVSGDRVVVLASGADALDIDDQQIALLSGILTYDLSAEAFLRSLRLICAGERVFPRDLAPGCRLPAPSLGSEVQSDGNRLSPREREVLSHLLAGRANKVIARQLGTSEATVKVHLKNLLRKIKVGNRTQAAIWALSNLPELQATPRGFV